MYYHINQQGESRFNAWATDSNEGNVVKKRFTTCIGVKFTSSGKSKTNNMQITISLRR